MVQLDQEESAVLFSNDTQTIFALDTPHSIAQAQTLSAHQKHSRQPNEACLPRTREPIRKERGKYLLSTIPLADPYPSTTEPKSEAARAKVLARIPESERLFHGAISPVVQHALGILRQVLGSSDEIDWCLPRHIAEDYSPGDVITRVGTSNSGSVSDSKKRPRTDSVHQEDHQQLNKVRDVSLFENSELGMGPPTILSSTSPNIFSSMSELDPIVKNPSCEPAVLSIPAQDRNKPFVSTDYIIPPKATFISCTLPLSIPTEYGSPPTAIPGIPEDQKFNLILFDPPWPNKSVRRSRHYQTHPYAEMDLLTQRLGDFLRVHAHKVPTNPATQPKPATNLPSQESIAAIWITNAEKARRAAYNILSSSGFRVCEEWIWVKVTAKGEPISPVDALWRKPYEVLVIGRRDVEVQVTDDPCSVASFSAMQNNMQIAAGQSPVGANSEPDFHAAHSTSNDITRRVVAAVPDVHSRKPNLRELFERVFFTRTLDASHSSSSSAEMLPYTAMEVFARNLTAGWWACGNEVLKFNDEKCWVSAE